MKKEYNCVICGKKKGLFDYVNVEELLKIKPNLKPFLYWDIRTDTLKKKVKICRWCYDEFKKCIKCKKNKPIEYEEIGQGKYCQKCLDEEHEIYLKEGGI